MPSNNPTDKPPMVPPMATTMDTRAVFHPKVPIMGGLIQINHDAYSAWTRGKPLANWTGLDPLAPRYEQLPNFIQLMKIRVSRPIVLALKPSLPRTPASI